jgi:glycosyltransferase involved in cell wall biosynthesis
LWREGNNTTVVEARQKLRVLACAFSCGLGGDSERFGGGEPVLGWNLIKQVGRFHEVTVLTSTVNRPAIEKAVSKEPLSSTRFYYFNLPIGAERIRNFQGGVQLHAYLWQWQAYWVARRLHRRHPFDVFHHITYANDWMASFIGALLPAPFIRGPGGGAQRTPGEFLPTFSMLGRIGERIRSLGQTAFRLDPFFRLGQQRARAILVCNREAFEALPEYLRPKAYLFPVNGVSSEDLALARALPSVDDGKFRVLSAGKLLQIKGFPLAIQAFKRFLDLGPKVIGANGAELTIIGDGGERGHLEALIRDLGLGASVRVEKWLARREFLERLASCDVFLFPSLRDGGGAVVVEAMAAGKPVICLDIAGPGMHVTEDCGIKVLPKSPEQAVADMGSALERLYTDEESRLRMSRAARTRAEQVYHWDRLGERLLEIYKQALGAAAAEIPKEFES